MKTNERLLSLLTFTGNVLASSDFFRSASKTLASDPGTETNLPSPCWISNFRDPLSLRGLGAPSSILNFAVLPLETNVASQSCAELSLGRDSMSNPTEPGAEIYCSATGSRVCVEDKLQPNRTMEPNAEHKHKERVVIARASVLQKNISLQVESGLSEIGGAAEVAPVVLVGAEG